MEAEHLRFREMPRTEVRSSGTPDYESSAVSRRRNLQIGRRKTSTITTCTSTTCSQTGSETAMDRRVLIVTSPEQAAA